LHDAELAAFFVDHPDLARPNPLVYANAVALPEGTFSDKSPSRNFFVCGREAADRHLLSPV